MVHCCVPGCTNFSTKTTNISYHKIPTDPHRQKAWISRLRRENLPPSKYCYVCSEHFEKECFELDLVEQLTGEKRKKKLKADALPSIFNFSTSTVSVKRRATTENRIKRQRHKETLDHLLAPSTSGIVDSDSAVVDDEWEDIEVPHVHVHVVPSNTRDFGTQCCIDARYFITKTALTRSDIVHVDVSPVNTTDACVQVDEDRTLDKLNILHDHPYCITDSNPTTVSPQKSVTSISPQKSVTSISPQKSVKSVLSYGSGSSWLSDKDGSDDDDGDYTNISASQETESSTDTESEPESFDTYIQEPKYLVFASCLKQLFKFCINCGASVTDVDFAFTGSLVTVKTTCMKDHDALWNSQPTINHTPVGNLLLCSSILFTGNTFTRIQNFASCLGLQFLSERVFYRNQDRYLFPVINDAWERERRSVVHELCSKELVKLNGDGRCDSPGHNAKYGTYTFMDSDSEKVVSFSVVQVTEVTSSNAMEKEGFVRCVDSLEDDDVSISCITTDRHISIASTMGKDYSHIDHQFDVWHLSKSVVKILNKKAKLKQCQDLSHWIQSVSNHLWWSAATCNGDVQLLREKWVSVLHHVRNKHSWNDAEIFLQCAHPRLNRREVRRKCWLEPGSAAYVALEEVVLKPKLLKDLAKLTNFCHTGGLEVYHSMMLKYCPKRQHFSYKGMVARTQLAAIDNNHNTGRNQAVIQKGERSGEARYRQCFPKMHKRWVVKPVLENKNYAFLPELQQKVLEMCDGTEDPILEPIEVDLPANIASEPAPDKQELIQRHRSRFSR